MEKNHTAKEKPENRRKPGKVQTRKRRARAMGNVTGEEVSNAQLAEFLARRAEDAHPPLTRAFRRAARRAFLWPDEALSLQQHGRSLTELQGIGPYLEKQIGTWLKESASPPSPPALRSGFLTFTQAQAILKSHPEWMAGLKGDLQMHTLWSDGSASIAEMAAAATELDYEYIAITDHAKGLKIAGGIDEGQLREQGAEIAAVNQSLETANQKLRVLRSIELNLNPDGDGDMEPQALAELDIVIGCFHSALRRKDDQTDRYLAAMRNPAIQILGHPR